MALYILLILVLFIIIDISIRYLLRYFKEQKKKKERSAILEESIKLDYTSEAKSLKRVTVDNPKARILCVDDEEVILDSFRKILVLDGYSIDTVLNGKEALGLIQTHHYDFVFTDLKMPEMSGEEVCKGVKHLRPDIDVIIITGYATVESAVECMKYGAMDYLQKPFTEEELLQHTKEFLTKRQSNIKSTLQPKVMITAAEQEVNASECDFAIPGGVFISQGHTWASVDSEGRVKVGLDDFAKKILGKIDSLELPNLGMEIKAGQRLFNVDQGKRKIPFDSPVSGKVIKVNNELNNNIDELEAGVYGNNWFCLIDADDLDSELKELKIGKSAVKFYQNDIEHFIATMHKIGKYVKDIEKKEGKSIYKGILREMDEFHLETIVNSFFQR